jgi:hypothetical protein
MGLECVALALSLVGWDTGAAPDGSELAARLGSARYAEREAAAAALERLGREALPALRRARSARDPEVRSRAAGLLERIESGLMVRPALVRLAWRDRPLTEAVDDLARQSGVPLALAVENAGEWAKRRLTVEERAPLPFWQALDRLCREAQVHYVVGPQPPTDGREPGFGIGLAEGLAPAVTSDSGPFRVELVGLHYQRDRQLRPLPGVGQPPAAEEFHAQLQVQAEPRLVVAQAGSLRLIEAVDDAGQSLIPPEVASPELDVAEFAELSPGPCLQLTVPLKYPVRPGKTIRRLRGTLPVVVAARRGDPMVIPLADARGRTFRGDGAAITVEAVRTAPNEPQATIELVLRPGTHDGPTRPGGLAPLASAFLDRQLEVCDGQGRLLPSFPQETEARADEVRMVLVLAPGDGATAPAQIRFFGLTRARAEVAFDFAEVPMP